MKNPQRIGVGLIALLATGFAGCSDDPRLDVRVHSDIRPAEVRLDLANVPFETFREVRSFEPGPFDDFLAGVEMESFGALPSGDYFLTVQLRDRADAVLVEQTSLFRLERSETLVFALGESCRDVTCPGGSETTCFAGNCVNPVCSSAFFAECAPVCAVDADCVTDATCVEPRCVEGVCLFGQTRCTGDAGPEP